MSLPMGLSAPRPLVWDTPPRPQHVGLVLGGGAARGLAHIGVLDVLVEHQIPIHMLAGCSVGALIGALYASGVSPQRMRVLVEGLNWGTMSTLSLYTMKLGELNLLTLKGLPLGLLDLDRMIEWLHKLWDGPLYFNDLRLPFAAIATDVVSGEMVVMNDGEVAPAVRASCSVPGIFTPYRRNGRLLVDGGVIDNLPIQAVREMGAEYVIAVDLLPAPGMRRREPESIVEISLTSLYVLIRASQMAAHGVVDCIVAPDIVDTSLVDLSAAQELIAAGRDQLLRRGQIDQTRIHDVGRNDTIDDAVRGHLAGAYQHIERRQADLHDALRLAAAHARRGEQVHCDHILRAHLAHRLDRQVVDHAAVHQQPAVAPVGGKDARHAAARAHRGRHLAVVHHHHLARHHIRSDGRKGQPQIVEVQRPIP